MDSPLIPPPPQNGPNTAVPPPPAGVPSPPPDPQMVELWNQWSQETWPTNEEATVWYTALHRRSVQTVMRYAGSPLTSQECLAFLEDGSAHGAHALAWYIETRAFDRAAQGITLALRENQLLRPALLLRLHETLLGEPPTRQQEDGSWIRYTIGRFTAQYGVDTAHLMRHVSDILAALESTLSSPLPPGQRNIPFELAQLHLITERAAVFDVGNRRLACLLVMWLGAAWACPLITLPHEVMPAAQAAISASDTEGLMSCYAQAIRTILTAGLTAKRAAVAAQPAEVLAQAPAPVGAWGSA